MASEGKLVPIPSSTRDSATFMLAPRKRRRRNWMQRRLASRRGTFELAIIGGGAIALALAALLPGMQPASKLSVLFIAACLVALVDSFVGLAPSIATMLFAPLVVALTDPMWPLAATLNDFTLGSETAMTFSAFAAAAACGALVRLQRRRAEAARRSRTPPTVGGTSPPAGSVFGQRQREIHLGPSARLALDPHAAAVRFDNAARNRQPQAGAVASGTSVRDHLIEPVEHVR